MRAINEQNILKLPESRDESALSAITEEYEKAKAIVDTKNFSAEPNQPGTYKGYIFGDYGLFDKIKNEMESLYHYDGTMSQLTEKAADNVRFYEGKGNVYQAKVNRKIEKAYSGREITSFYDTFGLKVYFKYDFSTLLILIWLCVFCRAISAYIYSPEHAYNRGCILLT